MVALYASADRIRARAAQLDPVKVLVVLVGLVPWLLFYTARFVWLLTSLLIAAGMEGWETAGRHIDARRPAADARGG